MAECVKVTLTWLRDKKGNLVRPLKIVRKSGDEIDLDNYILIKSDKKK